MWVAACGGTETPFTTRTGRVLHYMWNTQTGEHAYYDVRNDIFLSNEEAQLALGNI
jgi:neutral trehalase